MNQQRLAAAFFHNSSDAEQAVAALRQAGFARIGVAGRDDNQERKLAQWTDAQPGVAVSPDAGGQMLHTGGESGFADAQDMHATLLAANLPENEAGYFGDQMEDNGVLVTVLAPAGHWEEARRTLSTNGGDIGGSVATTPAPASAPARPSEDKVATEKKSVLNEIVDVGKRASQGTETVQDEVKREVLNVGEEAKAKAAEEAELLRRKIA